MVSRVQELALGYPEGRIELQLIGGFRDQQGYSEDLFSNIMRKISFIYLFNLYTHSSALLE
jgi:Protein N-terminal asparagine amidohydrolase